MGLKCSIKMGGFGAFPHLWCRDTQPSSPELVNEAEFSAGFFKIDNATPSKELINDMDVKKYVANIGVMYLTKLAFITFYCLLHRRRL